MSKKRNASTGSSKLEKDFLTINEALFYLGISRSKFYELRRENIFNTYQLGATVYVKKIDLYNTIEKGLVKECSAA